MDFLFLKKDCRFVQLKGFINKNNLPDGFIFDKFDDEIFDHEYSRLQTDYWDGSDFWGEILLPLTDEIYMHFDVKA